MPGRKAAVGVSAVVSALASLVLLAGTATAGTTWPTYHADRARTGVDRSEASLYPARRAWTAWLGGAVYGQAVVADGRIFAATEGDRVAALDPHDGRVLWSSSLGRPLDDAPSVAGCGDISPLGVTSTPVVDLATHTVYAVGEISDGGSAVHHQLVGFDTVTGAVTRSLDVDPPLPAGEQPVNLLQRAALALGNGRVYVSYGGNDGDCGHYHGWIVGVAQSGPAAPVSFEVAADGEGGAVWEAGSGPALDAAGDLYVSTGNPNGVVAASYSESVVKLSPSLVPLASFHDTHATGDEDLATNNPVLLPGGDLFAVGKTDIGYILRQSDLTVVATVNGTICGSDPDGGPAYDAATNTIYVPCNGGGIQAVDLTSDTVRATLPGADGAPILVGRDLWAAQYRSTTVSDFDPVTGQVEQTLSTRSPIPTFASPCAALGLLLIATTTGLSAFAGPSGAPPPLVPAAAGPDARHIVGHPGPSRIPAAAAAGGLLAVGTGAAGRLASRHRRARAA